MTSLYLLLGSVLFFPVVIKFLADLLNFIERNLPPDLDEEEVIHKSQSTSVRQHI